MTVIITGTSSGLGRSLVHSFNKKGYETIGISRSKTPETDYICDFRSDEEITKTFKQVLLDIDKIDYLVLNAGILGEIKKATKIDNADLLNVFQVNLFSNKKILDLVLNSSVELKRVIFISSGASIKAYDGWLSYCLTKGALNNLASCYAMENSGTHFLSLAPGVIQTKMQDVIVKNSEQKFSSILKFKNLYGKNPTPDIVANKIVDNLSTLSAIESGAYFDLRDIND